MPSLSRTAPLRGRFIACASGLAFAGSLLLAAGAASRAAEAAAAPPAMALHDVINDMMGLAESGISELAALQTEALKRA